MSNDKSSLFFQDKYSNFIIIEGDKCEILVQNFNKITQRWETFRTFKSEEEYLNFMREEGKLDATPSV